MPWEGKTVGQETATILPVVWKVLMVEETIHEGTGYLGSSLELW